MFDSDGIEHNRKPKPSRYDLKYLKPAEKHGGRIIMVWECFSCEGVGPILCIDRVMDQKIYINITKRVMLQHAKEKMVHCWIFQKDNDQKHEAKSAEAFVTANKTRILP